MLHDRTIQLVLTAIVAVAALNWAAIAFMDTNLLLDVLGLTRGTSEYEAVVGLIAVAAGVRVASAYDWYSEGDK
jgi:uncharacterized membrane protein YuzA (DUF378 family)